MKLTRSASLCGSARASLLRTCAAGLLLSAGLLPGCIPQETASQMAANDSVLAPLFVQPTERDAVAWANDEFNADKRARGTAMLAYSKNGDDPKYVNYLYVKHLTDTDSNVRATAAFALALHGTPDQAPLIAPLLKDPDRFVRRNACIALQRLHNPAAIDKLMEATDPKNESEPTVRAESPDALGQYAEPKVLQKLIAALDDPNLTVNKAAYESLRTLTGQTITPERRDWSNWAKGAGDQTFADRRAYQYPAFSREKFWTEYLPFMPSPPNEPANEPVGAPPITTRDTTEPAAGVQGERGGT